MALPWRPGTDGILSISQLQYLIPSSTGQVLVDHDGSRLLSARTLISSPYVKARLYHAVLGLAPWAVTSLPCEQNAQAWRLLFAADIRVESIDVEFYCFDFALLAVLHDFSCDWSNPAYRL